MRIKETTVGLAQDEELVVHFDGFWDLKGLRIKHSADGIRVYQGRNLIWSMTQKPGYCFINKFGENP